jgi:hypothetical protein
MKKVTIEQFLKLNPCYSEKEIREIAGEKNEWTALDVLNLKQVPPDDRLWAVLREEFIEAPILHEFACRCAERALYKIENPDPRLTKTIEAKRAWLRGEITDEELHAARDDAWDAARDDAWDAVTYAARGAARDDAWDDVTYAARGAAKYAAKYAERSWQIEELKSMLEGGE